MKTKARDILKYLISALIAALMLYICFRGVDWADFVNGLKACRWSYVLLSMAVGVLAFFLRALRWRQLVLPLDPSLSPMTVFNAVNIGYLANFVFPRVGEFVRCGVISSNSSKAGYEKVLGTVVLERSWDVVSMLLLLAVLLLARWNKFGDFFVNQIWGPASSRLDFSLWWIVAAFAVVVAAAGFLLWRFRGTNRFCGKACSIISGVFQGFATCAHMERKWMFLIYTVLIWASYWLMAAAIMWAVPQLDSLKMVDALFLSLVGSLGWIVPVPGGIGAFHFVVSLALSTIYLLPMSQGVVFATLSHEAQAVTMILFGGVSLVYEMVRRRKINVK